MTIDHDAFARRGAAARLKELDEAAAALEVERAEIQQFLTADPSLERPNGVELARPDPGVLGDPALPPSRREKTARVLAAFSRTDPIDKDLLRATTGYDARAVGIGVLVHHGYLKRKGTGYVRTGKPFTA